MNKTTIFVTLILITLVFTGCQPQDLNKRTICVTYDINNINNSRFDTVAKNIITENFTGCYSYADEFYVNNSCLEWRAIFYNTTNCTVEFRGCKQ